MFKTSFSKIVEVRVVDILEYNSYESSTNEILNEYNHNRLLPKLFLEYKVKVLNIWFKIISDNIFKLNFYSF